MTRHRDGGLPEDCAVRLIDLAYGVGAVIAMGEDGFANIYLNARLSEAARRRALRHELWHHYRGDMFREADIREIEGAMPRVRIPQALLAMDGSRLSRPAPVFAPEGLRRVGRGLYLPEGANLDKAARDIRALCVALDEACLAYDVLQRPPLIPVARLRAACAALDARAEEATAFIAWRPESEATVPALPVVLQFCAGDPDAGDAEGAIYYAADGRAESAVARLAVPGAPPLTVDLRRRGDALDLCALYRETADNAHERLY